MSLPPLLHGYDAAPPQKPAIAAEPTPSIPLDSIPKKPMRPLTAYHIFFQIEREFIIQTTAGEDADKSIHDNKGKTSLAHKKVICACCSSLTHHILFRLSSLPERRPSALQKHQAYDGLVPWTRQASETKASQTARQDWLPRALTCYFFSLGAARGDRSGDQELCPEDRQARIGRVLP